MPKTEVIFFKELDGKVPFLDWMRNIPLKAQSKCAIKIERLSELGHELRRPEADLLRDKIYELRASFQGIHYRVLYFFQDSNIAVIVGGIIKEKIVPKIEIDKAIECKQKFATNPLKYTYKLEKL
jgi:hypothetical protein